jgi:hypothetical protein
VAFEAKAQDPGRGVDGLLRTLAVRVAPHDGERTSPRRLWETDMDGQLESKAQFASLDAEGILHVTAKPGASIALEDAQEIMRLLGVLGAGRPRPSLIDLTGMKAMSREARTYFAGPETGKIEKAAALLITSPLGRALGNFFMGLNKPIIPTRLFTSQDQALVWLRGFLE